MYRITTVSSPLLTPFVTIQLSYTALLEKLYDLSLFLADKGLVEGWDSLPVTMNGSVVSWNYLLHVRTRRRRDP